MKIKIVGLWMLTLGYWIYPKMVFGQDTLIPEGAFFTLEECVEYALENSPRVKQALLDEQIGDREIKSNLAGWYPQASLNFGGNHNIKLQTQPIGGELITFGQRYNSNMLLQVSQTLFDRDQLFAGKSSGYIKEQWDQNTRDAQIGTVIAVSKAYYDILLTFEQLKILEENRTRQEKQYKDARSRFESGLVDRTDYQRAAISLANIKSDQKRAQESVEVKISLLKQLMGYPEGQEVSLSFDYDQMERDVMADTTEVLNPKNRVEYQLMSTSQQLSQLNTAYEKWAFLPRIEANYNYNWLYFNNQFSDLYQQSFPTSTIGVTLGIPLFQGGKRVQQIKMAELQERKLEVGMSDLKKQIQTEYQAALSDYKSNLYEWKTLQGNMEMAHEVYEVIKLQYDEGIKAYVDLVMAETELRTAQLNHYNALYNVLASKLDLEKALGNIEINGNNRFN